MTASNPASMQCREQEFAEAVRHMARDAETFRRVWAVVEPERTRLIEQLEAAETTLAHALDFIEHQDMNYRWAEWCEGRNPSTPASRERE